MTCQFCGSAIHVWWDCPKKPDGWKPKIKSTAARKDVRGNSTEDALAPDTLDPAVAITLPAGTQAPPVDRVIKLGRPRNGFDKAAYNRDYMRRRRAEQKAKAEIMKQRTIDAQNQLHRMRTITE